jgi:son of sevenless-like protein
MLRLHNYHGAYAVFSALTSSTCRRLKQTLAGITTKRRETLDSLRVTFKPDFSCQQMRHAMKHAAGKPCVPHMGIFLSDLTMMDEIPSKVAEGCHINFHKCRKVSGLIERLQMYQEQEYALIPIPSLAKHLTELAGALKRTESFALSKKCEPG